MLAINQDLLYDKPTHIHPEYGAVKVFVKTAAVWNGQICFSAEIMTGTDKGKMTTVEAKKLTIYQGDSDGKSETATSCSPEGT